jgi:hypothetical protein
VIVDHDPLTVAFDHRPFCREIKRHDGNIFLADVLPDVGFRPIGQREDTDGFPVIDPGIVEVPKLRTLRFGIPTMTDSPKRKDAFLGARFFLVAPGAAEHEIEAV